MQKEELLASLKKIEVFKDIPEAQLEWLVEKGSLTSYKPGDYLFRKDDPIDKMLVVLDGLVSLKVEQNGNFREITQLLPGGISGTLPYSRASKATAIGIAEEASKILQLDKQYFKEMINHHHELTTALVHIMTSRVREFTVAQQQNDKMMSLGKLSAGLAHELNNPASAVVRNSSELKDRQNSMPDLLSRVIAMNISAEDMKMINEKIFNSHSKKKELTLEVRTALEDELIAWLEAHKVEEAYAVAETFADFNFSTQDLDLIKQRVSEKNIGTVLEWIDNSLVSDKLVLEINESAKRISELVNAIKSYSHMDRAPEKENIDIRDGINNTLTMLAHKLKQKNISVVKDFQDGTPKIEAFAGMLNQVWTNLLDNAIDAVEEGGTIEIISAQENGDLKLEFIDSGPGIPEEIKSRIFDPFYTTKDVGKGTGLGLDIVQKIIQQHKGSITVESKPSKTIFKVCLPIE